MNIRIGIVEDNIDNIKTLKYLLNKVEVPITLLGEAQTMEEAYVLLKDGGLDLVFLDIQLRKGTIFDVLERLYKEKIKLPEMIFVTAHGSFENALNAIRFACIDFVTKPVDKSTIQLALDRYKSKKELTHRDMQKQVGFLLNLLTHDIQKPASIAINLLKGIIEFTDLSQIVFIEADENMSKVKLANNKILRSVKHLGHYIDLLFSHQEFVQISKACLVNTDYLKQYNHREKTLILKNGESLIASHRFSRNLRKQLLERQQKKPGLLGKWFGN
jgi:two-component system LytT family response regulator